MPNPVFQPLFDRYPEVIAQMPQEFDSHEFILSLAQQNQADYVAALAACSGVLRRGTPRPFMTVHRVLSGQLNDYPELLRQLERRSSKDIFGRVNTCARWRKV